MYRIFERIDQNLYQLRYQTNDLQMACDVLNAFKGKYLDRQFILFDEVI